VASVQHYVQAAIRRKAFLVAPFAGWYSIAWQDADSQFQWSVLRAAGQSSRDDVEAGGGSDLGVQVGGTLGAVVIPLGAVQAVALAAGVAAGSPMLVGHLLAPF